MDAIFVEEAYVMVFNRALPKFSSIYIQISFWFPPEICYKSWQKYFEIDFIITRRMILYAQRKKRYFNVLSHDTDILNINITSHTVPAFAISRF